MQGPGGAAIFFLFDRNAINNKSKMGATVYQREIYDFKVKLLSITFYGRRERKITFSFFLNLDTVL